MLLFVDVPVVYDSCLLNHSVKCDIKLLLLFICYEIRSAIHPISDFREANVSQ